MLEEWVGMVMHRVRGMDNAGGMVRDGGVVREGVEGWVGKGRDSDGEWVGVGM